MPEHGTSEQKEAETPEHPTAELIKSYLRTNEPTAADNELKKHLAECEQCRQAAAVIQKRLWDDIGQEFKGF